MDKFKSGMVKGKPKKAAGGEMASAIRQQLFGAGHMFGPIKDRFQQFVAKLLKKQATKIKAEMVDIRRRRGNRISAV